jgi:hypothetical protein
LQCSKWGEFRNSPAAQTSKFLIPIFPRFKPAALIGAQPQGLHYTANTGLVGSSAVKARLACFEACFQGVLAF